jgi:hypothetical protein
MQQPHPGIPFPPRPATPRNRDRKKIFAIVAIVAGLAMWVASVEAESAQQIAFNLITSFILILPGAWWFLQEKRDRAVAAEFEEKLRQHEYYSTLLGPTDPDVVTGMGLPDPPKPVNRRWPVIGTICFLAFLAAIWVQPEDTTGTTGTYRDSPTRDTGS